MKRILAFVSIAMLIALAGIPVQLGPAGTASFVAAAMGGVNEPGRVGVYNVLNYGARGDGRTDDTAAIQRALNAAAKNPAPVYLPPGTYKHSAPLRITGSGHAVAGAGPGVTRLMQNYLGPGIIVDGAGFNALTYGPALVGTGRSLNTSVTTHYIELNEGAYNPVVGGLSGASAFDVEFWYQTPSSFPRAPYSFMLSSNIGNPGQSANGLGIFRIVTNNSDRSLTVFVRLSTGLRTLTTPHNTLKARTTYDVALDYDGSHCRVFLNGVAQTLNGTSTAIPCSGSVVQSPFETIPVPNGQNINWPLGGYGGRTALPGFIDAIHISKASRHAVNYKPAASKPVVDTHTVLLENFQTTSIDGTQLAATAPSANGTSTIYLTIYGGGQGGVGIHLHDMELCSNGSGGDGVTVFGWGGEYDHLSCIQAGFYGISFPPGGVGTFYENVHDNSVAAGAPNRGNSVVAHAVSYFYGNNFTEGRIVHNTVNASGLVGSINYGNAIDDNSNFIAASPMRYPFVSGGQVIYSMPFDDLEGGDPQMLAAMLISNNSNGPPTIVNGAQFLVTNNIPVFIVNGGAPPILNGIQVYILSGTPNEIVDFTQPPRTLLPMVDLTGLPSVPLSNMPQWITTPGCGGAVTLSNGSGTLTNVCVTTASTCAAVDTTARRNGVEIGTPSNGSVALKGTGSDVIKVVCQ